MSQRDSGIKNLTTLLIVLIILLIIIPFLYPLFAPYMGVGHMQGMAFMMGWGVLYFFLFIIVIALIIAIAINYTTSSPPPATTQTATAGPGNGGSELDSLMRILTPEEKVVLNLLIKNGGEMLQKDISRELGFPRVKTHRILERMEERNLIKRIRMGNTNKVLLEDWILRAASID